MRVSGPGINIDQQAFNDFLTNREGIDREDNLHIKLTKLYSTDYKLTHFKDFGDNDVLPIIMVP